MKLPSRSKSRNTIAIALLAAGVSLSALSGCSDSSGDAGNPGLGGNAAANRLGGGGIGGESAGAGGAGGNGGAAAGGQAGAGAASGGAGGANPHPVGDCAATAPATSGIDPTTRLDALTDAQKAVICDWAASRYCGYDKHFACPDGSTVDSFPTQAYCVANMTFTSCAATVADSEACERDATCDNPFPDSCIAISECP